MSTPQEIFPPSELVVRGQKIRFATFADLTAFWNLERNSFRPLLESSHAVRVNPSAQFVSHMLARQNGVDNNLNELTQALKRATAEMKDSARAELQSRVKGLMDNVLSALRTLYAEDAHGNWISTEPQGQFILELAKANKDEAAYALLYLRGANFSDEFFAAKSGMLKAHFFKANLGNARGEAELAAIAAITANWRNEAEKMVTEMTNNRTAAVQLNETHAKALDAQAVTAQQREDQFKEFMMIRDRHIGEQMAAAKTELEKLASTYDQHMKLQAPVAYWRNKKDRHLAESARRKFWVIFMGTALFLFLAGYVWLNFHEKAGVVPWREIVGFFVLSSMVFWVMKVLVRLFLSAIHLAEDAAEREVMAMTYMALVRGDETQTKYLDEKDRALVLAPLFRPSSTGVIDDGAPPHVSEIITKLGR